MKFSIVFENTGDTIPFVALNPEVVEYYVDQLATCNLNNFQIADTKCAKKLTEVVNELHQGLTDSNVWMLQLFDYAFETFENTEYLDQDKLNYLHSAWVNSQSLTCNIDFKRQQFNFSGLPEQIHDMYPDDERFPVLGSIVNKIGKKTSFDKLNTPLIHGIEESFTNIIFKCSDKWVEFNNPFPKDIINNDICNLFLPFAHLGRSQYNKFKNFDFDLKYNDENTFNELIGVVGLSLTSPETIGYSKEYIEWCKTNNRVPSGERIPMGNIPDLMTNLKKYRIIVHRNTIAGNKFHIDLHKG